jgi:hypothetical protein
MVRVKREDEGLHAGEFGDSSLYQCARTASPLSEFTADSSDAKVIGTRKEILVAQFVQKVFENHTSLDSYSGVVLNQA